jgi:plasmid stability protein
MAQLIVRNIEETIVKLLKIRAARHGRSAEAEHREILREALQGAGDSASFEAFLLEMPDVGKDSDFERLRDKGRKVTL